MNDFADIPMPPPRHAKSFRRVGRWCIFAAAFLAPWSIFIATTFFVVAAFICFLGCALSERRFDYSRSLLFPFLAIFLVVIAVSAWFSIIRAESFFGMLAAPDSLLSFLIYFLLFFLSFFFFRHEDVAKIGTAIGSGLFVATIVGWLSYFHGAFFVPFGTSFGWGVGMVAVLAALAVIRPGELTGRAKLFFFIAAFIALASLVLLNDQFLWLTLAIFIMIVAALRFGPREQFQYAFVIIALSLFFALISPRLPTFPQTAPDARPDVSASLAAVQGTLTGHAIFLGSGPATFAFDFYAFRPTSMNETTFWMNSFPEGHDFAITLLATTGIIGLLLFIWIVILAIQPFLYMQSLGTDLAMFASASAFLLAALFLYPASLGGLVLLFILLGVFQGTGARSRRTISFDTIPPWQSFAATVFVIAFAAAGLAGAFVVGEQYLASVFSAQASTIAASGDLGDAFAKINAAIALDPTDAYYRTASSILISEAKVLAASTSTDVSAEAPFVVSNAIQAAENAVNVNQRDPANWGNLGAVYESVLPVVSGASSSAESAYQEAGTLDPSDPVWDLDMGRVFMESGDYTDAQTFLTQAITLKDDYTDPRVLLVQLYLQEGNIPQAIEKVQELEEENPLDPGIAFELGYLYYYTNQFSQAAQQLQVATILDPDYANAHYFLGLAYSQEGMQSQALTQFEKVQALNPDNAQVAQVIANLQAGRPALTNSTASSTPSGQ